MDDIKLEKIYQVAQIDTMSMQERTYFGHITEKEKFHAAKQILFGLAILYVITLSSAVFCKNTPQILDICKTVLPSLATFILGAYFRDRHN